jgi:uncharacterized protein (DUF4213/DUF364 family)
LNQLLDALLGTLLEGRITKVLIGLHWTAVVAETEGVRHCGLASTLSTPHRHHGEPDVPLAGKLEGLLGSELAILAKSSEATLASVGVAAMNALLPHQHMVFIDQNAEDVLAIHGAGKRVALIGRFPFVPRLRKLVGDLVVLEKNPLPEDLPSEAAPEILPQADVVAITGTTFINHTVDELIGYCSPRALVVILGPSTPLSPVLFDHGVDIICGSLVESIEPVLGVVGQGGNFRQVRRAGVRTVTEARSGYNIGIERAN